REPRPNVHLVRGVARQQRLIAPDARRPALDAVARHRGTNAVVVVRDLQRPKAVLAREDRRERILTATLPASQRLFKRHGSCSHSTPPVGGITMLLFVAVTPE